MMNRRDEAVLEWTRRNTPQHTESIKRLIDQGDGGNPHLQAVYAVLCIAFDAGRQFQHNDPTAELNNPGIY